MKTSRFLTALLAAVMLILLMSTTDTFAQKKKTAPTKSGAATVQTPPAAPQSTQKMGNTLRDLLVKYKGELTTLGVLTQVEADYFVVEEDGTSVIHPYFTIASIKMVKPEEERDEEEPAPKLDIRLQ